MDVMIYKRTVTTNSYLFKWNVNLALVYKPDQVKPYLTFYYDFIYKDILANYIKLVTTVYDLLSILLYQSLLWIDIKHGYCIVNLHLDNLDYLVFYIPCIDQV